jgi:hypothetical protein
VSSGIARRTVALNGTNGNEHCAVSVASAGRFDVVPLSNFLEGI